MKADAVQDGMLTICRGEMGLKSVIAVCGEVRATEGLLYVCHPAQPALQECASLGNGGYVIYQTITQITWHEFLLVGGRWWVGGRGAAHLKGMAFGI
jgi:hypothetical protein